MYDGRSDGVCQCNDPRYVLELVVELVFTLGVFSCVFHSPVFGNFVGKRLNFRNFYYNLKAYAKSCYTNTKPNKLHYRYSENFEVLQ